MQRKKRKNIPPGSESSGSEQCEAKGKHANLSEENSDLSNRRIDKEHEASSKTSAGITPSPGIQGTDKSSNGRKFVLPTLPIIASDAIDTDNIGLLPDELEDMLIEDSRKGLKIKDPVRGRPVLEEMQSSRLKPKQAQKTTTRAKAVAKANDEWEKSKQSEALGVRIGDVSFYMSQPNSCSYLPDRMATSLFAEPGKRFDQNTFTALSELGFRRSGNLVYKPQCKSCDACQPIRIPIDTFQATRSQKRVWKRNQDLIETRLDDIDTNEHYSLYERYINVRHKYGTMYPASRQQYRDFLAVDWPNTFFVEHRDSNGVLKLVAVMDKLRQGYAAVYTFFDPHDTKRSLGVFSILSQIEYARKTGCAYVYLGYYINESTKMNYKAEYEPFELLSNGHWRSTDTEDRQPSSKHRAPSLQ